jgi:hypothetical protein
MAAVYICVKRTDIPNGVLQLLDLSPNTSQRNGAIDPKGQTKYLGRPANDTVALSGGSTPLAYHGIAAYLLDHVEDNVADVAITPAVANAAALGIIARLDAGSTLAAADVNARLVAAGAGAGTQLTGNGSNGVLANLLSIVAGGDYLLPAGTLIAGTRPTTRAAATFGTLTERKIYASGAPFNISYYEGQIAAFLSATFNYGGNESPALPAGPAIVIYTDAGALYTGP